VLVLFGVSTVLFGALHLTGDPAVAMAPPGATSEEIAALRTQLGLDDALIVQYGRFIAGALALDFGNSYAYRRPALALVLEHLPATLELTATALAIAVIVAVPLGIIAAISSSTVVSRFLMLLITLGQGMPGFWIGLLLILMFSVSWHLLPSFGQGGLAHLVLPAITLAAYPVAKVSWLMYSGTRRVMSQDFIRTALAKGLPWLRLIGRHTLPNVMIPVVTVLGLDFGFLLGSAVVTETIFSWPGIGRQLVLAILQRD